MNNDQQKNLLKNWLENLGQNISPEPEEKSEEAVERISHLLSGLLDSESHNKSNEDGWVLNYIEEFVSSLDVPDAGILRHAFLRACSQARGKLEGANYRARIVLFPMVARSREADSVPKDIDVVTARSFVENIQESLKNFGRPSECFIPISGLFSPDEMDNIRPSEFYSTMRYCLQYMGMDEIIGPFGLHKYSGKKQFKKNRSLIRIENSGPNLISWTERSEVEDSSLFVEDFSSSLKGRMGSHEVSQSVAARFLAVIWVAPEGAILPLFLTDHSWLSRASDLLTQGLMCADSGISNDDRGLKQSTAKDHILDDNFSLSMLGAWYPLMASIRLRNEMMNQHISSAVRWCASNLEAKGHWKNKKKREASILYDAEKELLVLILDGDFQRPDIKMKAENSAWLYQFMSKIARELEDVGFDSVSVKVLDEKVQSSVDISLFQHIH